MVSRKGPVMLMFVTFIGPVPESVRTTVLAALVVPMICEPKLSEVGLTDSAGAVAVAHESAVCVEPRSPELSVMVRVPSRCWRQSV